MLNCITKEVEIDDEGSWGLLWGSPKWAKVAKIAKMANIYLSMRKLGNRKAIDECFGKVL